MKRVNLWLPDAPGTIHMPTLRLAAVAIAIYAVGANLDPVGRVAGDPVFERVTEGRQWLAPGKINPKYSACGDLAHYVLRCLGCRDEALVNRNDDGGDHPWQSGVNIARLVNGDHAAWCPYVGRVFDPQPGDPLVVEASEHVRIVRARSGAVIDSCDYGQFDYKRGLPAGLPKSATIVGNTLGGRPILGYLDLERVAFVESAIVPDDFEGGVPDENPYDENGVPVS